MADPTDFSSLPEGCIAHIAHIASLTSPKDACRLAVVCSGFKSAADSDAVWDNFLPYDYQQFLSQASEFVNNFGSKKKLYFSLCDTPLIIDHGKKSFWLDKRSGKKCFMSSARDLLIIWGDTPRYWNWISEPESRFPEVAELISVCWLEIRGRINSSMLSQNTRYAAYLVFKVTARCYGFDIPVEVEAGFKEQPVEDGAGVDGSETPRRTVYLDVNRVRRVQYNAPMRIGFFRSPYRFITPTDAPEASSPPLEDDVRYPKKRGDDWYEVELGEFFNDEESREVEMSVAEVRAGNWKCGIVIQGIEIRPKEVS